MTNAENDVQLEEEVNAMGPGNVQFWLAQLSAPTDFTAAIDHFGALYLVDVPPISVADTVMSLDPMIWELIHSNQEAVALANDPTAARVPATLCSLLGSSCP